MHKPVPQVTSGDGQVSVQTPLTQIWSVPQAWPQAPQLVASLCRLTQPPLQGVVPVGQTQAPLTQTWLAPQTWPQAPQFSGSVCTAVQQVIEPLVHFVDGAAASAGDAPGISQPPSRPPRIKRREFDAARPLATPSNHCPVAIGCSRHL
jgi:hypothetical protein